MVRNHSRARIVIRPSPARQLARVRRGALPKQRGGKGGCMKSRAVSRGLILLIALAFSFPAWAVPAKKTIHIQQQLQVGDTTLAPGDYTVAVDGNEATFQQGKKIVAKVSCAVKDSGQKYSDGAVIYANTAITEIRFAGQSQVITFNPTTTTSSPKSPASTSSGDR